MKAKDEGLYQGKSVVDAPRWYKMSSHIKSLAWSIGVKCEMESEKNWLREHIRFRVTGTKDQMILFRDRYKAMMSEYGEGK